MNKEKNSIRFDKRPQPRHVFEDFFAKQNKPKTSGKTVIVFS